MSGPRIAIVGAGPVGRALGLAYRAGGGEVVAVASRSDSAARGLAEACGAECGSSDLSGVLRADVAIVAVPDRALEDVGARIAALPAVRPLLLLHTSGALEGAVLGGSVHAKGSLHPLQSFPASATDSDLAARVAGTHWFHEGAGVTESAAMVDVWRGTMHRLAPGGKSLYHAGAAVLSNHTVALFDAAVRLFEAAGVGSAESGPPLATLLQGTSANLERLGVPAALTGPIARGDVATIRRHLDAIRSAAPELTESYVAMARRTLVVARAKGTIAAGAATEIERLLG